MVKNLVATAAMKGLSFPKYTTSWVRISAAITTIKPLSLVLDLFSFGASK